MPRHKGGRHSCKGAYRVLLTLLPQGVVLALLVLLLLCIPASWWSSCLALLACLRPCLCV